MLRQFLKGLDGKIKFEVVRAKPAGVSEAIAIATDYVDCCMKDEKEERNNVVRKVNYSEVQFPKNHKWKKRFLKQGGFDKKYNSSSQRTNFREGQQSFVKNNRQGNHNNNFNRPSPPRCHNCGKIGHIADPKPSVQITSKSYSTKYPM